MHVTACLAGQKVDVKVGEDCHTLQTLRECIVKELPQLCVEGFDVSVGGRALDSDEGVVSLEEGVGLDVVPNTRGLTIRSLREGGREVSEAGLLDAAERGGVSLCTSYLDAGVPIDCADGKGTTPLHHACRHGYLTLATLLLDRGSAIDEKDVLGDTPLHDACCTGHRAIATLLLDRGSTAIDEEDVLGDTPLHDACLYGHVKVARLLLDRGACSVEVEKCRSGTYGRCRYPPKVLDLLSERGHDAVPESAKRRRIG